MVSGLHHDFSRRLIMKTRLTLAVIGSMTLSSAAFAGGGKMDMMDTNNDGSISASEHAAGAKQMFQKMDADSDGKVTAAEMDSAHQQMKGDKDGKSGKSMSSSEKIKPIDTNGDGEI